MSMSTARNNKGRRPMEQPAGYRVGDQVQLTFGSTQVSGVIVEDRGEIGVGGRRLLRIRLQLDPSTDTFIEVPIEELKAA